MYFKKIEFVGNKRHLIFILSTGLAIGIYLLFSSHTYAIGLPLDDSWIYQTYARNLVKFGRWVYEDGQVTGGATGPLWVIVLAISYLLELNPLYWAYFISGVLLFLIGEFGARIIDLYLHEKRVISTLGGVIVIFEWHNVWAAVSGMETIFFECLLLLVFLLLLDHDKRLSMWFLIGLIIGVSVWVRPDGLTLLGPALFLSVIQPQKMKYKLRALLIVLFGFGITFAFYLLFNYQIANTWWPNTFYAKQAEYSILRELPYFQRLLHQFLIPITGVGALFLPGFLMVLWRGFIEKKWELIALSLWCLGFLGIYAYRLPVTYQHGRYAIPMITTYIVLGFIGTVYWFNQNKTIRLKLVSRVWGLSIVVLTSVFWLLGANAYGKDVAAIETEMVAVARWVRENTPKNSIIAVHDIGAIGYFSNRKIIDLAGLVSPDVIPIIRDEAAISTYLEKKNADYLVTFPNWYPDLVKNLEIIYSTNGQFAPRLGGENMAVYLWKAPKRINPY